MSRISLLLPFAVAAGVVGCAQCDTCDDFPAPCVGPNCGQNAAYPPPALGSSMMSPSPTGAMMTPPAGDAAPAIPNPITPPADSAPMPSSPPTPADPAGRPGL